MAKFFLLQVLLLLAGPGSAEIGKRLIGGGPCTNTEQLRQVWIFHHRFCGGTLIDAKWVLTASHCYNITVGGSVQVCAGVHPNRAYQKFNITLGDIHIFDVTERTGDIMLLKLPGPVSGITPAKLPDSSCQTPVNGEHLQIAGHGSTVNQTGPVDLKQPLQGLDLQVTDCPTPINNYLCGEGLPNNPPAYTCGGDSGGGWLKKRTGTTGVIYGVHKASHIQYRQISLSTSVCAPPIRKWINDIMTNH